MIDYWIGGIAGLLIGGFIGYRRDLSLEGPSFPGGIIIGFLCGIISAQLMFHGMSRKEVIDYGENPIMIGYLVLVVAIVWGGWKITSRIETVGKRIFWRSGALAVAFAPGIIGFGHGGVIIPALLSAMLVLRPSNWGLPNYTLLSAMGVLFLFAIGPILATWFVIL